ncbi:hypothetical protein ACQ4M3_10930 [Leptolyngbya sp. AN03gr2]|uniref:hypothetical protein n=1 Tax=unclassified Leptolyngbya TaxID=2650499 RepID=UPI003D31BF1B
MQQHGALIVLNGIKQRAVVGKDGKIEIQNSEFAEGTVVEVIVLVEQDQTEMDETEYLLSTKANRDQLMSAIQTLKTKTDLITFTPEEWNEEYNIPS